MAFVSMCGCGKIEVNFGLRRERLSGGGGRSSHRNGIDFCRAIRSQTAQLNACELGNSENYIGSAQPGNHVTVDAFGKRRIDVAHESRKRQTEDGGRLAKHTGCQAPISAVQSR